MANVYASDELKKIIDELKASGKRIVFTNGCFDILHASHVDYLNKAKVFGDILIVGLYSDKSVRSIKVEKRQIVPEIERAFSLANLKAVDFVTFFDEDTPERLIQLLIPNILVKGADWPVEKIIGRDFVEAHGGIVETIKFVNNTSTTDIIKNVLEQYH